MDNADYVGPSRGEDDDATNLKSPEDAADRFGIRVALVITCIGFLIAAVWLTSRPNFQTCTGLDNLNDRVVCYESVRTALAQPPAK
jgi:hypothetical protein